jgi:16S rRNA C1402 (ribose-2'-O) methylase RsmI
VNTVVCRELTKIYESIYRGEVEEVYKQIVEKGEGAKKGEFVIIINVVC